MAMAAPKPAAEERSLRRESRIQCCTRHPPEDPNGVGPLIPPAAKCLNSGQAAVTAGPEELRAHQECAIAGKRRTEPKYTEFCGANKKRRPGGRRSRWRVWRLGHRRNSELV